jgi:hypothetical protein
MKATVAADAVLFGALGFDASDSLSANESASATSWKKANLKETLGGCLGILG